MKLYRCLILDKENERIEDIYLEKNKKILLNKLFKEEKKLIKILEIQFERKIKEKDLEKIYFKIGRLLNAGLSLKKSIEFQKNSCKNLSLKFRIFNLYKKLEKGEDIYEILRSENLIKERELLIIYVSENAGKIGDGFLKVAYLKQKKEKLKSELKIALSYPTFVLFISIIIILLIFYFIVPNFQILYEIEINKLPFLTRIILNIQNILNKFPYTIIIIICVVFFSIKFFHLKKQLQKVPFIKKYLLEKYIINILENLSLLLESGISIDKGIDIILENLDSGYLKNKMFILKNIKKGELLSECFKRLNILSLEEIYMIKVGEESGTIEMVLKEISFMRDEELNKKIKIVLKLSEPILLLIVGVLISAFVIGLYLPILNMSDIFEI
ncbi:MAG: type II secretion system F family protein [Cetobacterium sp.]|uniref:type II secretion system F family protein n=4 Tax=Bacteria TaxID=2 RepID=UPI001F052730|nr:type II secretion system F family protein [Cetobacterium somerae]MCX3068275.1 type II secretion system F family protein [Cetobacterium somerae]UPO97240.1 type II secretion system F family protein [Cetobacterium somerae]